MPNISRTSLVYNVGPNAWVPGKQYLPDMSEYTGRQNNLSFIGPNNERVAIQFYVKGDKLAGKITVRELDTVNRGYYTDGGPKYFSLDIGGLKKAVIQQLNNRLGWSLSSAIRSATSIASKIGLKRVLDSVNTALKIPGVKGLVSMVPGLGISITALQQGSALLDSVTSGNVKSQAKLAKIAMLAKSGNPAAIKLRKALRALYLNKKRQALLAARRGVVPRPDAVKLRDNRYRNTMIQGYEIGQDDCNEMSGWLYNKPFRAMEDDAFAPRKLYSRGMSEPVTKFSWK
jgi:hypothetical protein